MDSIEKPSPEVIAAIVNGCVFMALPLTAFTTALLTPPSPSAISARVWPPWMILLREVIGWAVLLGPCVVLAVVVGWRTRIHAKTYLEHRGNGWRGVVEAAAIGGGIALLILLPDSARSPLQPRYLIGYGGGATLVGAMIGVLLRTSAAVTLKLCRR
jgi:hypothetical protein